MDIENMYELNFKETAENLSDSLFGLDTGYNFIFCNRDFEILTGLTSKSITGKNYFEIFPSHSGSLIQEKLDEAFRIQSPVNLDGYSIDGDKPGYSINIYPFNTGITVLIRNTSLKPQLSLQNTLDNLFEGCAILDSNWNYLYLNNSHAMQIKTTVDKARGNSFMEVVPGIQNSRFFKSFEKTMKERIPQQAEDCFTFMDGSTRWYEVRSVPVPEGIFLLSIETTERKKYESELLKLQSVFNQAEKMAHLGSWWLNLDNTADINSNPLHWSEEVYRIFGYEPYSVEVSNELFFEGVHPDDRKLISDAVASSIKENKPYSVEHRVIRPDGSERIVLEHAELRMNKDGNPEYMIGAVHDITEFKNSIDERTSLLHEVEYESDILKSILRSVPDEIWVFDTDGQLMFVNEAVKNGLGFDDLENLTLKKVLSTLEIRHIDGKVRHPEESALFRSLKGEIVKGEEMVRHLKTGEFRIRQFHSAPMRDKSDKIFGVVVVVGDITERKKAEERIQELLSLSQRRTAELNTIIDSIPDAIFISNKEQITQVNGNALKILGADSFKDFQDRMPELAKKYNVRNSDGTPLKEEELQIVRALSGETIEEEVLATNVKTGEDIFLRVAAAPIVEKNKVIGAVAVESDITEKKIAEEALRASLKEKEVLLRELYHRTKNNMQVISSLLNLKAADLNDPRITEVLEDMKNRIQAISLVHQKLYQSKNLSRVNIKDYIEDLVGLLKASHLVHNQRIEFDLNIEEVNVLLDTAVPCGLIINELISNSLKYAFPGNRKGIIKVEFIRKDGDYLEMTVSDNGIGLNGHLTEDDYNLGLRLFNIIAEDQLQADTSLDTSSGVSWRIKFKDILYDERV